MYIHKILINHIQSIYSSACWGTWFPSSPHRQTAASLSTHNITLSLWLPLRLISSPSFGCRLRTVNIPFLPFLFPSLFISIFGVAHSLQSIHSPQISTVRRKIRGQTRAAKAAVQSQLQNIPRFNNCSVVLPQSLFNFQRLHWRVAHSYTLNQ